MVRNFYWEALMPTKLIFGTTTQWAVAFFGWIPPLMKKLENEMTQKQELVPNGENGSGGIVTTKS